MDCGLDQLFSMIDGDEVRIVPSCGHFAGSQGELFDDEREGLFSGLEEADFNIIAGLFSPRGFGLKLPENARRLFELSVNAFDAVIQAWMSELPVTGEIVRFGRKVLAAADAAVFPNPRCPGEAESAQRRAAERAAGDSGDPVVRAVLEAAYKVSHEVDRLRGLLRFCPDGDGVYIARCEPDHFILPALGPHFKERFGQTSWVIIDEKRRLCLRCTEGRYLKLSGTGQTVSAQKSAAGEWENLWRHYHKTINNESRNNPGLQKKFMPKRYWKYLTEL